MNEIIKPHCFGQKGRWVDIHVGCELGDFVPNVLALVMCSTMYEDKDG